MFELVAGAALAGVLEVLLGVLPDVTCFVLPFLAIAGGGPLGGPPGLPMEGGGPLGGPPTLTVFYLLTKT